MPPTSLVVSSSSTSLIIQIFLLILLSNISTTTLINSSPLVPTTTAANSSGSGQLVNHNATTEPQIVSQLRDPWQFWRLDLVSLQETLHRRYPFLFHNNNNNTHEMIPVKDYYDNALTIESTPEFLANNSAQSMQYSYEKSIEFTSRFTRDYSLYSDPTELKQSGWPTQNRTQCLQQLRWLHRQLLESANSSRLLTDKGVDSINLVRYVDSFGRPEAASYVGNNHWYGSYDECLTLQFEPTNNDNLWQSTFSNRYCLGKLRSRHWPENDNFLPRPTIKIGLCVPRSCDTQMFATAVDKLSLAEPRRTTDNLDNNNNSLDKNNNNSDNSTNNLDKNNNNSISQGGTKEDNVLQLINDIMLMNFSPKSRDTYKLVDVYCLPDEQSPIRELSSSAYVLIGFCSVWCLLVLVASLLYLHREQKRHDKEDALIDYIVMSQQQHGQMTTACDKHFSSAHMLLPISIVTDDNNQQVKVVDNNNNNNSSGKLLLANDQAMPCTLDKCAISGNNLTTARRKTTTTTTTTNIYDTILNVMALSTSLNHLKSVPHLGSQTRVNLIPLSFLKVVCTLAIVGGHTAHWNGMSSKASKIVLDYLTLNWVQITLVFAYAVDTFYVMAGVLFGYFTMKKLQDKQMPANTLLKFKSWLGINGLVWFRLSTIYIPVYWFSYSLAVHLGSGPMWDYGTNENSFRGTCIKQTRWYHFILYSASLGRDHTEPPCNEPAWFIETYIRIFLVLPPITYLLIKYSKWSSVIVGLVVATTSFVTGLLTYNQTAVSSSYALKYAISAGAM